MFKGEDGERVITVSADTVIRGFLLPWRARYKGAFSGRAVDAARHARAGLDNDKALGNVRNL